VASGLSRPPRSTAFSKPILRSTSAVALRSTEAMIQPITRMTRKPTNFGTNDATDDNASSSAPWTSSA